MMESVFPIVKKISIEKEEYYILATGFFIDDNGFFVTTGHTFKNDNDNHDGYFIGIKEKNMFNLVPVLKHEKLYRRVWIDQEKINYPIRNRKRHQYGPEFRDLAIGKIDLKNNPFLRFQKKKPYEWNNLTSPCYNKHPENCPTAFFVKTNDKVNIELFQFNNRILKLKNRNQFSRIPFFIENEYFKRESIDLYNNCFEVEGIFVKGNSGAPILNEKGLVVGIFLGSELLSKDPDEPKFPIHIHASKYVNKKAKKLREKIQKNS